MMMSEKTADLDPYIVKETIRRQGFEFDGIRNHEYYFGALEGGSQKIANDSALAQQITDQFESYKMWERGFKKWLTGMRGIGWAMLGYDSKTGKLLNYWVDEQHLGHLTGVQPLLALDMWEHSYCMDYAPSEKKKYVDAYFKNLNWSVVEDWFDQVADK